MKGSLVFAVGVFILNSALVYGGDSNSLAGSQTPKINLDNLSKDSGRLYSDAIWPYTEKHGLLVHELEEMRDRYGALEYQHQVAKGSEAKSKIAAQMEELKKQISAKDKLAHAAYLDEERAEKYFETGRKPKAPGNVDYAELDRVRAIVSTTESARARAEERKAKQAEERNAKKAEERNFKQYVTQGKESSGGVASLGRASEAKISLESLSTDSGRLYVDAVLPYRQKREIVSDELEELRRKYSALDSQHESAGWWAGDSAKKKRLEAQMKELETRIHEQIKLVDAADLNIQNAERYLQHGVVPKRSGTVDYAELERVRVLVRASEARQVKAVSRVVGKKIKGSALTSFMGVLSGLSSAIFVYDLHDKKLVEDRKEKVQATPDAPSAGSAPVIASENAIAK